jgi:hypothetical protein
MANDREVLREIWEGRLPVCFQLNSEEVYSLQAPDAYYLMVPRLSYFPLVTDKVRNTRQNFIFARQELECYFVILNIPFINVLSTPMRMPVDVYVTGYKSCCLATYITN